MPTLSVYFGSSEVSFAYVSSPKGYKFYSYPYIYSKDLFGHFVSEEEFYISLIDFVSRDLKIEKDYDLIVTGFPEPPKFTSISRLSLSLDKVLAQVNEYYSVLVNDFTLVNPNVYFSAYPKDFSSRETANYYSNASIFPQSSLTYESDVYEKDNHIRFMNINTLKDIKADQSILFSGDRFCGSNKYEALTYQLMLDLVKDPGIFELKLDLDNILPVLGLLGAYDSKLNFLLGQKFWGVGTLINSPGYTECLIERETGPSNFVEVRNNELFFVPLDESSGAIVKVKGSVLGSMQRRIIGGKLGIIIDTRQKTNPQIFTQKYFHKNVKNWETSLKEVLSLI